MKKCLECKINEEKPIKWICGEMNFKANFCPECGNPFERSKVFSPIFEDLDFLSEKEFINDNSKRG